MNPLTTTPSAANEEIDLSLLPDSFERDWMNSKMTMQDLFVHARSAELNKIHKIIFGHPFRLRLLDGQSVTTSSMLHDTVAAMTAQNTMETGADDPVSPAATLQETPEHVQRDIEVLYSAFSKKTNENIRPTLRLDTQQRIARIENASEQLWEDKNVDLGSADWTVKANEDTYRAATDIATCFARNLKRWAGVTDSVATE